MKITDDQARQIGQLTKKQREDLENGLGTTAKQLAELEKSYLEKAVKLLSDDQKKQWGALIGKPFTLKPDGD